MMRRGIFLLVLPLALISCNTAPTPTPLPQSGTAASTQSPLPPVIVETTTAPNVPTELPTQVSTLAPIPTLLPTVTVAPTAAVVVATRSVALKFPAPIPLSPARPKTFKNGDDIPFDYGAVGKLAANQCYLLHIEMINPAVATKNNRGDDFLDKDSCGDQSILNKKMTFTLFRGKFLNSPNYGTILSPAAALGNTDVMNMTWNVRVVQNNGLSKDGVHYNVVPLSPTSGTLIFDFNTP